MTSTLDQQRVNSLRFLSIDAVQKTASGHPGLPMGAALMAYVRWTRFLKHSPSDLDWFDRFVLSAGHGSMLLYSLLTVCGYALPLDQIEQFRQWGSAAPGHPGRGHTPGVEVTTGPLGKGFGNAVGMAMAEANLAARYNRDDFAIIDHTTYAIVSDGDLMEGVASAAASLAGHLRLGKLICLYDDNNVTLSAGTDITFTEDRALRVKAYGWHTEMVEDGNDLAAIAHALDAARSNTTQPSLILVRTHLGYGSPNKQDSFEAHGSPLGADEVRLTKQNLGWPTEPAFLVPDAALAHFREAVARGQQHESQWRTRVKAYAAAFPDLARELQQRIDAKLLPGWDAAIPVFPVDAKGMATRVVSGDVMNAIAPHLPALMDDFEAPGVEAHGATIPFSATFLIFSDYMHPPMRLAALMGLHVVFVFTHDSIALGEDGPTHQPVEQLASLRALPRLSLIRPGDANETAVAWRVVLVLTRAHLRVGIATSATRVMCSASIASARRHQARS